MTSNHTLQILSSDKKHDDTSEIFPETDQPTILPSINSYINDFSYFKIFLYRMGFFIGQHPKIVLVISIMFTLIALLISAFFFQIINSGFNPWNTIESRNYDSLFLASKQTLSLTSSMSVNDSISLEQIFQDESVSIIYHTSDPSILAPSLLSQIESIENYILKHRAWPLMCLKNVQDLSKCSPAFSLISFIKNGSSYYPPSSLASPQLMSKVAALLGKEWDFGTNTNVKYLRSIFFTGSPSVLSKSDRTSFFGDIYDYFNSLSPPPNLSIYYAGNSITLYEVNYYIYLDAMIAAGAIILVFIYMNIHTRSVFLSLMGIFNMLLSMPLTYLFCVVIIRQPMNPLNFSSLFILFGIGADDCFIVFDFFYQTPEHLSLPERLGLCLSSSAYTMFMTTITTLAAFLANLNSAMPVIRWFGIFSASAVFFNYLLVCTLFISCVCIYHSNYHFFEQHSCHFNRNSTEVHPEKKLTAWQPYSSSPSPSPSPSHNDYSIDNHSLSNPIITESEVPWYKQSWGEILSSYYLPFISRYRFIIMFFVFSWLGVAIYFSTTLSMKDNPSANLPDDSNLEQFQTKNVQHFLSSNTDRSSVSIQFVWGIDDISRPDFIDTSNYDDLGTLLYDDQFSLFHNQNLSITICNKLKLLTQYVQNQEVICPMEGFKDYVGLDFPIASKSLFMFKLKEYLLTPLSIQDKLETYFGFDISTENILFYYISFTSTLPSRQQASDIQEHYDFWDKWLKEQNLPQNFNCFQTSEEYVRKAMYQTLTNTAFSSLILSVSIAFLSLLIVSGNILLTFYAIITIGAIVCSLIGCVMIFFGGMAMGESLALTVSVGLSVDYTIHLEVAYSECKNNKKTRYEQVKESLYRLGRPITSSAITTLLASACLLFSFMKISRAFGAIIFLNILFSYLFCIILFVSILIFIGPTGQYGQIFWRKSEIKK